MKKNKYIILTILLTGISFATTYNTPVIDGTITESTADWDADENMGLRSGTGSEDWYHYITWDANYLYIGFGGFNWPDNSNNHIVGHFDFVSGGSLVGINGEDLGITADFAFELTRVGPNGVVTFSTTRTTSGWSSTTIPWPSTDFAYNATTLDTEFRISWSVLTQGEATIPTPFVYYTAVENNSDLITQIWPEQDDYSCGLSQEGPDYTGVSPNALPVDCDPDDQPLPVELSSFSVGATGQGVLCEWTTESETENLGFILERKTEDTDWSEIVSYKSDYGLLGQGSITSYTDYEYLDINVEPNTTYEYRLADIDFNGVVTYHSTRTVTVEQAALTSMVEEFTVLPAYPNPFNPSTTIKYVLGNVSKVTVAIYDIAGNLITTLVNTEQAQGWHSVIWNGTNQLGEQAPAGQYLSRITSENEVKTTKLLLLK